MQQMIEQNKASIPGNNDLDAVADNYRRLRTAVPRAGIYYAVKANPAPEILKLLAKMGSSFDTASVNEVDMALATGVSADDLRGLAAAHGELRGSKCGPAGNHRDDRAQDW